ncbi:hypothetical protein B0H14DRAFT_2579719 [Mycena olivaceomarginata]|nr:hypothetical protein B0H14DRAFT_2579719 [Mycena olivaceomarginata]
MEDGDDTVPHLFAISFFPYPKDATTFDKLFCRLTSLSDERKNTWHERFGQYAGLALKDLEPHTMRYPTNGATVDFFGEELQAAINANEELWGFLVPVPSPSPSTTTDYEVVVSALGFLYNTVMHPKTLRFKSQLYCRKSDMPRDLPFGRVKPNADSAYLNAAVLATNTQPLRLLFAQIVYSTDSGLVEKYRELEASFLLSLATGTPQSYLTALNNGFAISVPRHSYQQPRSRSGYAYQSLECQFPIISAPELDREAEEAFDKFSMLFSEAQRA